MVVTKNNSHYRPFLAAYNAALSSEGVGGSNRNFRLGAAISYKGRVLVARPNCFKTHSKLIKFYKWPFLHAEAYSILSLGMDNCRNKSLYVVRIKRDNSIAMAKPCLECQDLIDHVGISNVYFTDGINYESLW